MFENNFDDVGILVSGNILFNSRVSKYEERKYSQTDRCHNECIMRLGYTGISLGEFTYLPPDGFSVVKLL